MALFAKLTCYPSLGQLNVIPAEQKEINFVVLLESSRSLPEVGWEVSLWYHYPAKHAGSDEWADLPLHRSTADSMVVNGGTLSNVYRKTFTGVLPGPASSDLSLEGKPQSISFTLKYRVSPQAPWEWVRANFGTRNGELVLQRSWKGDIALPPSLQVESGWEAQRLSSEAVGSALYSLESSSPIPKGSGEDSKVETLTLGTLSGLRRFFALVRIWSPWFAPRHGTDKFQISEDAVLCSFLTEEGQNIVLLAVNGIDDTVTTFKSDDQGRVVVAARNDGSTSAPFRVLVGVASDFEAANSAVMDGARKLVRESAVVKQAAQELQQDFEATSIDSEIVLVSKPDKDNDGDSAPDPQWMENWYDGLAYCTWNSLGQNLTAEKILSGLESLASNDINVSSLIIDDNWQSLDGNNESNQFQRGWMDFEANKEGFPKGLKATIMGIRRKHPNIRNIAVWHALFGYWGGISPDGRLAKEYKTVLVDKQVWGPTASSIYAIHPDDVRRMYNDFYSFLSSCGITSVKTDAQFILDTLASTPDRAAFIPAYQSAWTLAHLRHFYGKAISCMSQIPQIMFHSFLPTNTPRILVRNSDDFFPEIPSSHPWHVFCNAHNALFVQHLNALPDWDMFQTSHPYSGFHAAARCVSGGPIYITDSPGQHDVGLIHQMTAHNIRGQTVILRPSMVGKSIGVYDDYLDGQVLKVGTYNGAAETGTGIVGIFNVSDHEITFFMPITDFPGVDVGMTRTFVVRSHQTSQVFLPVTPTLPLGPESLIQATLPVRGYDILSVYPVHSFTLSKATSSPSSSPHSIPISIAVLGLLGKMSGPAAIIHADMYVTENSKRLRINVGLKALGVLGLWISDLKDRDVDEGLLVTLRGQVVPRKRVEVQQVVDEDDGRAGVLEVDVAGAWKDLGFRAGWSNEVWTEIFIG